MQGHVDTVKQCMEIVQNHSSVTNLPSYGQGVLSEGRSAYPSPLLTIILCQHSTDVKETEQNIFRVSLLCLKLFFCVCTKSATLLCALNNGPMPTGKASLMRKSDRWRVMWMRKKYFELEQIIQCVPVICELSSPLFREFGVGALRASTRTAGGGGGSTCWEPVFIN